MKELADSESGGNEVKVALRCYMRRVAVLCRKDGM